MNYTIRYSDLSIDQLRRLRAFDRTAILDQIKAVLTTNPDLESKARVKRLRQPAPTQFRLRVGEYRVFYDVDAAQQFVDVAQVMSKEEATEYLENGQ